MHCAAARSVAMLRRLERREDRRQAIEERRPSMSATHEDAMLIVELAKLGAMTGVSDASRIVFAEDFDPDSVETSDPSVQKVLNFSETIATLVKNDLLDRDLVHDWLWITGIWERLGPAARRARDRTGSAALYENVEALANVRAGA